MRYEHIELDLSTASLAWLQGALLDRDLPAQDPARTEMWNLRSEIAARLQRRDPDPRCPKNAPTEEWLDT